MIVNLDELQADGTRWDHTLIIGGLPIPLLSPEQVEASSALHERRSGVPASIVSVLCAPFKRLMQIGSGETAIDRQQRAQLDALRRECMTLVPAGHRAMVATLGVGGLMQMHAAYSELARQWVTARVVEATTRGRADGETEGGPRDGETQRRRDEVVKRRQSGPVLHQLVPGGRLPASLGGHWTGRNAPRGRVVHIRSDGERVEEEATKRRSDGATEGGRGEEATKRRSDGATEGGRGEEATKRRSDGATEGEK